jgi:hypothetical protein
MKKALVIAAAALFIASPFVGDRWSNTPTASAQDRANNAVDILQRLMVQGKSAGVWLAYSPGGGHEFDGLIEAMVQGQDFVCHRLLTFEPRGQFERGYFAKVECRGDAWNIFAYRFEVTQDFERYSVRVWSPLLDD